MSRQSKKDGHWNSQQGKNRLAIGSSTHLYNKDEWKGNQVIVEAFNNTLVIYTAYSDNDPNKPLDERPNEMFMEYIDALGSYCEDLEEEFLLNGGRYFPIDSDVLWTKYLLHDSPPTPKQRKTLLAILKKMRYIWIQKEIKYLNSGNTENFGRESLIRFDKGYKPVDTSRDVDRDGCRFILKLSDSPIIYRISQEENNRITALSDRQFKQYVSKGNTSKQAVRYIAVRTKAMKNRAQKAVNDLLKNNETLKKAILSVNCGEYLAEPLKLKKVKPGSRRIFEDTIIQKSGFEAKNRMSYSRFKKDITQFHDICNNGADQIFSNVNYIKDFEDRRNGRKVRPCFQYEFTEDKEIKRLIEENERLEKELKRLMDGMNE